MENLTKMDRRKALGTIGTSVLALGLVGGWQPATAQQVENPILRNPNDKYPKPPFQNQSQPWPGLCSKMEPKPDHGEETYKGSGRLNGRKAVIIGGDSGMVRVAALAYPRDGADVVINYLPDEEDDTNDVVVLIISAW